MEEFFPPKVCALFKHKGYNVEKEIGRGAFGLVYKGTKTMMVSSKRSKSSRSSNKKSDSSRKSTKTVSIAVKVMDLTKVGEPVKQLFLPRELQALIAIRHPNTIHLYDIIRANHNIFIFMEYASNGDLAGLVRKETKLSEKRTAFWFGQVSEALAYIHKKFRMAHRDIKLDNVLLDKDMNAKLTDFGFAKMSWDSKNHRLILSESFCGTPVYSAPQIHAQRIYNPYLADVYSMGVMLYCMIEGRYLFMGTSKEMLAMQLQYPDYIKSRVRYMSSVAASLLLNMCDPDEEKRYTMRSVIKSEFLAKSYLSVASRMSNSSGRSKQSKTKQTDRSGSISSYGSAASNDDSSND